MKHSYSEPHWEKRAAQVAAFEQVSLPELKKRGYDERTCLGSLCGARKNFV